MANVSYEHAGNEELRRQIQNADTPRCQVCQYHDGQIVITPGGDYKIKVSTFETGDGDALLCQHCGADYIQANTEDLTNY